MKRIQNLLYISIFFILGHSAFATSSQIFNVQVGLVGLVMNIPGIPLLVNTTIPAKTYQYSGIKVKTPGFSVISQSSNCTMAANGYCLFSVSDTSPAQIFVSGGVPAIAGQNFNRGFPTAPFVISLCLNGKGSTYSCEDHTIDFEIPVL